jgi:hypothetical protein
LLLRRFEIRDEAMDIVEFAFCDPGQSQLTDGLSAPGVPLPDGIRFNVQLLLDELFELIDALPLLRRRSGQGMQIPREFRHLLHDSAIGLEVRIVAGDQVASMTAFGRDERLLNGPQQLNEFMAGCIEPAVLHDDGGIAIRHHADDQYP